jgi:3-hydroxyacyl-[acyl-carrier-protein] dehydratase
MNIYEIRDYLPHRYPFLLVDRVVECVAGKYIVALKNVTANEPFFNGHFPLHPVMPGVLVIEALAQASGILAFTTLGIKPDNDNWFYLAGVDNTRFKRIIIPGDQVKLRVEILRQKRSLWVFAAQALVGDELAVEAELMIAKGALK